jgi:predicted enzyme related to lactoylglutathione lyase
MLSLNTLMVFSEKPKELSKFYTKVLHKEPDWSEGDYNGYKLGCGSLMIGPHDKVHGKNSNPERIIFNFETENVEKEFSRLKDLGVKVVKAPYHPDEESKMTIATLSDPEGNFFQLASPMAE